MKLSQIFLLLAYSVGMSFGQLLFKQGAMALRAESNRPLLLAAVTNVPLLLALLLYAGLTALWVYILSSTELSKAYPFMALAFVITPVLANVVLHERLPASYLIGLAAIILGLVVIALGERPQ
jgi:drug/metabolite transporter (DMT)-like permease